MLIQELFLKANDKLLVKPRVQEDVLKMSLVDEGTKKLRKDVTDLLRTLFERFAISKPETPDILYLGTEQVTSLIDKISTKDTEKPKDVMAYNMNDDLTMLLYEDFENYFEQKAAEKPEIVRACLAYVGIRADMKVLPQPGDNDDSLNPRATYKDMPRYKVSNDPRTFSTILECLDQEADTRKEAKELILQATTNERIEREVLEASPNMFTWDNPESDSAKEAVYTLSMVEQILYNSSEDEAKNDMEAPPLLKTKSRLEGELALKDTWVPRFLK